MSDDLLTIERTRLVEGFDQWQNEQDTLASQIAESLAALGAYQEQLEAWQLELEHRQQQCETSGASNGELEQKVHELNDELTAARQTINQLTTDLLAKTDELRELERSRVELLAQLEQSRAREQELMTAAEVKKRHRSTEQNNVGEELRQMRALLESYANTGRAPDKQPSQPAPPRKAAANNPVLGSVVAQFDKLRKQQAMGRVNKQPKK